MLGRGVIRSRAGLAGMAAMLGVGAVAGCGIEVPHSVSMPDRCADMMRLAMPFATFEIGNARSRSAGIDSIVADVEAVRTDPPAGAPVPREVAVECRFDGGVLVGFRWTKGGPKPSP